ncbi:MAG: LutC/YkgG family protein [Dongiaceae bacterium]
MSGDRAEIMERIRRGLGRGAPDAAAAAQCDARLASHAPGPIPARGQVTGEALVQLFMAQATKVSASVERLADYSQVPAAVTRYLKSNNLPAEIRLAPDPLVSKLDWSGEPLLTVSTGASDGSHLAAMSPAFAGVAETATLMLISGAASPTTLNFLPDHHLVLLPRGRLVGTYEEAWTRLRDTLGAAMPRAVNLITGPSRSADIGHVPQLGAHGPRRLHILLVDGEAAG